MAGWVLGLSWLAAPVIGVPVGIWMVALGLGIAAILSRRLPGLTSADLAAWLTPLTWRFAESATLAFAKLTTLTLGEDRSRAWSDALCRLHDRLPWWETPLRIGLDTPRTVSAALVASPGVADIVWFEITEADIEEDPNAFCEAHGLDALVSATPEGLLRVVTLRREGHDASLPDWTFSRRINLGTLFPHGADPATVDLPAAPVRVHRAAIEFIAALTRSQGRLSLADRLAGRRPMPRRQRLRSLRPIEQARGDTPGMLATALIEALEGTERTSANATCVGAISAWAASNPDRQVGNEDHTRRGLLERAALLDPGCVRTQLRLAAARIIARDDHSGLDALARAYTLLRQSDERMDASIHTAFLDDALQQSPDEPASVGRVAAGLALLMVATPQDQLDYLRDDMMDEARYARWLIGRDQDTTLLAHVFRRLAAIEVDEPEVSSDRFPRRAA